MFRTVIRLLLLCLLPIIAHAATPPNTPIPTENGPLHLSELKGKVVYVDFWASWCAPCRQSFPWMNEMQARYKDDGLVIIGVNLDKDKALIERFLADTRPNFTIGYDPEGELASQFDVQVMPSSFLIDREGELVLRHRGFREKDTGKLEQAFQQLLK